jgi:hypothetical protein
MVDISTQNIQKLFNEAKKSNKDLYSFLKEKFPDIKIEDRLKYLAAILNDYLEHFSYDQNDKLKDEGYLITKFFPLQNTK